MEHPVVRLLQWFPECDFAILEHGFAAHGRDYHLVVEHSGFNEPGRQRLMFTHVVELALTTEVRDDVWPRSWSDEFIDYGAWEKAGTPEGYVWGTNWSLAYPGLEAVIPSDSAANWSERIKHPMHEALLTSDRFRLRLIFHDLRTEKIDGRTDLVSQVVIPLA